MPELVNANVPSQNKWTPREELLADILPAIETAHSAENFSEALEIQLLVNADLRNKVVLYRTNPLIAKRLILRSLPSCSRTIVSDFIRDLLISGGRPN